MSKITTEEGGRGAGKRLRMSDLTYINALSPVFSSWRECWNQIKDAGMIGPVMFPHIRTGQDIVYYKCDIDFIKARCWDEIEGNLPTKEEIEKIYNSIPSGLASKLYGLCSK